MSQQGEPRSPGRDTGPTETILAPGVIPRAATPAHKPLERGAAVGRYVILDRIGGGGMGVVYAGYDPELDRKVALKLLRSGATEGSDRLRLLREAQAIARLSHPNVIAVHDAGTFGDQVFIAMEFVEGSTLRHWLEEERRPWREITNHFILAGRGLAAAHAAGLVHRDFKPDNVLLARDGRVRVVDFGLARPAGEPDVGISPAAEGSLPASGSSGVLASRLTEWGVILGTPVYMAPEQIWGEPADARSDQFSFCVALYEALYGERPFAGENGREIAEAVERGEVRQAAAGTQVPMWLRQVLLRGLSAAPEARFPSMDALLGALVRDPGAVRRRWLAAAAVLLVTGALFSGLGYSQARRTRLCSGAAEEVAGIWDPARKAQVRAAFHDTGLPFAANAWRSIEASLDRYLHDWEEMSRTACEATRLRKERSETLLDRQMLCLSQRLQQAAALIGVLSRADAQVVEHAADSLQALDGLAVCASPAALLEKEPLPNDPARRVRVQQLQTQIARARALQQAGKIPAALALAKRADRQTAALSYAPLQGEAALLVGDLEENAGEFEAAERDLFRALAAAEKGRDDLLKARSWTKLVYTVGYRRGLYENAHRLARLGEAALARAGGDSTWQAELLDAEAAVFKFEGKLDEALRCSERSLAITEKHGPRDRLFVTLSNMGGAHQLRGDPEKAHRYFLRALAEAEARRGRMHPETTNLYFNLGGVFLDLKRYREAEKYLLRSLVQREQLLGTEHPDVAESLDALAVLWVQQDHPERALGFSRRSLQIYARKNPGSVPWALAHNNLGESLRKLGRYDEALGYLRTALDGLAERKEPENMLTAALLDSLGKLHLDRGRPAEALPPLERALRICDKAAPPDWQAEARFVLARALWESGNRNRALQLAREAKSLLLSLDEQDKASLAEVEAWLAQRGEREELPLG